MHRSIFPESRSRTATGADLNRLGSWVSTRIGSAPPARFDDAQPWPLFLPPRRDELGNRSGSRNRRRFRADPAAVRPASASRCWPRYVIPIATACEAASSASVCTGRLVRASAQSIPFADATFDAIVMTWTLCSIPNPIAALTEMRRVLKPGGRLLFVEHGLSPETRIARWQHRLTPYWKRIGGGCHLDRKMGELIHSAGFEIDAIETGYMRGPKPWAFMYQGSPTI